MTDDADVLRHDVSTGLLSRLFIGGFGGVLAVSGLQEVVTFTAPAHANPLLAIALLLVRIVVGGGFIHWALFTPTQRWTVRRGFIEIENRNPFRRWRVEFGPDDVKKFDIRKNEGPEEPTTWVVVVSTHGGKHLQSRHLKSLEDASKLLREMQDAFYGLTPGTPLPGGASSTIATRHEAPVTPGGRVREL